MLPTTLFSKSHLPTTWRTSFELTNNPTNSISIDQQQYKIADFVQIDQQCYKLYQ